MNLKNSEGYPDPTAGIALANVAKTKKEVKTYRPLVYIASPFTGDTENNIIRTKGYCRFAINKGAIPLAPHLHYPQFMDDADAGQRTLALKFAMILLGKCDELWVFGNIISNGMVHEIGKAQKRGMTIKYFNINFEEITL